MTSAVTATQLPKSVMNLLQAREAVRRQWMKANQVSGGAGWSPETVDVRAADIDQIVQFAQDVRKIVQMAQQFNHSRPDLAYQAIFATNVVDRLERLQAMYFREDIAATP